MPLAWKLWHDWNQFAMCKFLRAKAMTGSSPDIEIQIGLLVYAHGQRQTVFMSSAVKILVEISGTQQ
jgi:hypothetical protein